MRASCAVGHGIMLVVLYLDGGEMDPVFLLYHFGCLLQHCFTVCFFSCRRIYKKENDSQNTSTNNNINNNYNYNNNINISDNNNNYDKTWGKKERWVYQTFKGEEEGQIEVE